MIRVMIDTDELSALTDEVELLATYADLVPDLEALQDKYPHSQLVLIDRGHGDPQNLASVLDVERGLVNPGHVPEWLDRKERQGINYRTVYCNRSTLPDVDRAGANRTFYRWVATLDGTAHIEGFTPLEAPAAVQVIGATALGYHADLSLVFDEGWNRPPLPHWLRQARELAAKAAGNASAVSTDTRDLAALLAHNR